MKTNPLPSQEKLHYLFYYNEKTGKFYARFRGRGGHSIGRNGSIFTTGYRIWMIEGVSYRENRLIWRYVTGEDPGELIVEHKDEVKLNNKFENLRLATKGQNTMNQRGTKGISFNKASGKWVARIMVEGVSKFLGYYSTEEEALKIRRSAEQEMFGEFAPSY